MNDIDIKIIDLVGTIEREFRERLTEVLSDDNLTQDKADEVFFSIYANFRHLDSYKYSAWWSEYSTRTDKSDVDQLITDYIDFLKKEKIMSHLIGHRLECICDKS